MLCRIALGVSIIVALGSGITYYLMYKQIEQDAQQRLREYSAQRAKYHESYFALAKDFEEVIKKEFLRRYQNSSFGFESRFDRLMMRYPDGAMRNRPEFSDVMRYSTGWIHKDIKPDNEFKRTWMLEFDLSEQYSRIVITRFLNLWFLGKSLDANMGFDRQDPAHPITWAAKTAADYLAHENEPYYMADETHNPQRATVGSAPYYEPVFEKFLVSLSTPIYVENKRVAIVGISMYLDELEGSVLQSEILGASHAVFRPDGLLIASADQHPSAEKEKRSIRIAEVENPYLHALLSIATKWNFGTELSEQVTGYKEEHDFYYAVSYLPTPGWYFASMLPGQVVRSQAFRSAQWIGWMGLGSSAFLLAVLAAILRHHIVQPLHRLLAAIYAAAGGDPSGVTSVSPVEEMEKLGSAFNDLVRQVAERDTALTVEKERFRALIEHAVDVIAVIDANGIYSYVSPSVEMALGYPPAHFIGKSIFDFRHPDDVDTAAEAFQKAFLAPGVPISRAEYRLMHARGDWRMFEVTGTNQVDNPSVRGLVINARDISDAKEAEAEISRQREVLYQREKLAAMGSLLAGVAHELNNPLSIVVGRAIMLEEDADNETTLAAAQKIRAAAERCSRIVKTFLAMARQHKPQHTQVQLNSVIEASLEMLGYGLRTSGINVETSLESDLPSIAADADLLHQVFINLIINAQQALSDHSEPRRLRIASWLDPVAQIICVEVTDNGPGIPEAIRSRIFDPYFTTKPVGIGTGVGLSVSLGIIEAHSGTLELVCPPKGGAIFTVHLPVQSDASQNCSESAPSATKETAKEDLRRILIVDDEEEVAALLSDILSSEFVRIDIAACGLEALQHLKQDHRYDAIISDLRMPGMDGPALYQTIQARWPELTHKIIFVTGDALSPQVQALLTECESPVIEKPFIPADVRRKIAELVAAEYSRQK